MNPTKNARLNARLRKTLKALNYHERNTLLALAAGTQPRPGQSEILDYEGAIIREPRTWTDEAGQSWTRQEWRLTEDGERIAEHLSR